MTTVRDKTLEARYGKREAARRLRAAKVGVGFFVGAGIPKGERVNTFIECGCCGAYHRTDFEGDCREDSERHWDLPDDAVIIFDSDDECEFEQRQPHEWYCVVHDVTKIAGTTEPVRCDHEQQPAS